MDLAHSFGVDTVAEGIKDEETLVALAELGVDMAQGYHTGRPGPLEDALTRLGSSGAAYSNT